MNSYESAVGQLLARRLQERIGEITDNLASGGLLATGDPQAIGSQYRSEVSYIRALRDVMEICKEIEADLRKAG